MTSSVLMENNNGQQNSTQTPTTNQQQSVTQQQNQHIERSYYNPSRRKATLYENRASTYNMNRYQHRIIGKHHGSPWRPTDYVYEPGVLG